MNTTTETMRAATDAALERALLRARFTVQTSERDDAYGYLVDTCMIPDGDGCESVRGVCLPKVELLRRVRELRNREWRYILAKGSTSPSYYGFGAAVVDRLGLEDGDKTGVALVQVPREHADWQIGRLFSGMQTVMLTVFETAGAAVAAYAQAVENGAR